MPPPKRELVHGTRHGYVHHACRCHACHEANRVYGRNLYRQTKGTGYVPRGDSPHRANDSVFGKALRPDAAADSWWCVADDAFMRERDRQLPRLIGVQEPKS